MYRYCGGVLCVAYPNFVEQMYAAGVITAPVISLYNASAFLSFEMKDLPLIYTCYRLIKEVQLQE